MKQVRDFLSSVGIDVDVPVCDGRMHRDGKGTKPLWYIVHKNHAQKDGKEFFVIVAGDWRTDEIHKHCTLEKIAVADRANVKKQMAEANARAEAHRLQEQSIIAKEVEKKWESLNEEGESAYLEKKKIDGIKLGIKFDGQDIYVPARDADGKLWTLQKIQPNGFKQFHTGARFRSCFHQIGDLSRSDLVLLSEGLSTGASIAMATSLCVVVCFNAGNLVNVAGDLKKKYPDKQFLVCGDNDLWAEKNGTPHNPGLEKATEASEKCLGKVVTPEFSDLTTKPTDWNDLHCLEGIEKVKEQILSAVPKEDEKLALYYLGFRDGEYFFTSTQNRQVVPVNAFTEDALLKLMPLSYWEQCFGNDKGKADWQRAKTAMIDACQAKGIFQSHNVRGAGVWSDQGRVVVNMGNYLVVDGQRVALGALKSRFFYTLGKTLPPLHDQPLSDGECTILREACAKFKWTKPESGVLLAGALIVARICGAVPVRPHVWITGGAETGKTTLLEKLIRPVLGESKLYVQGNTTEAGLRQSLKADAVPVLFDEFETNGPKSAENIAACIELMRASWSDSGAVIIKGGSSGNAAHFQVRFSAIVSSIRTRLNNDADRGRTAVCELAPHGSDATHWNELSGLLAHIDEEYSERLFARTIWLVPVLLQNFKLIKAALARRSGSRFGDTYGMLLAGYSILLQSEPINESDAEFLAENIGLEEERDQTKQKDEMDALNHLLTTKVRFDQREMLIGEMVSICIKNSKSSIDHPTKDHQVENALLNLGIKVELDFVSIVSRNHAELEKTVWRGTKWSEIWGVSLARITGTLKSQQLWLSGKNQRSVKIPICIFE